MSAEERKLKLFKAVAKVFKGITVEQFNKEFAGWDLDMIERYLRLVLVESLQFGEPIEVLL